MHRQKFMLALATGAMSAGVLLYAFDRQHDHVYFLPGWLPHFELPFHMFDPLGNYLPTFLHVYAFILLTVIVATPGTAKIFQICLAWFTLDSLLELAQIHPIAKWIAAHTPDCFSGIPFLENTANYFLFGRFDVLDLLSIAVGTLGAYLTIHIIQRGQKNETYS